MATDKFTKCLATFQVLRDIEGICACLEALQVITPNDELAFSRVVTFLAIGMATKNMLTTTSALGLIGDILAAGGDDATAASVLSASFLLQNIWRLFVSHLSSVVGCIEPKWIRARFRNVKEGGGGGGGDIGLTRLGPYQETLGVTSVRKTLRRKQELAKPKEWALTHAIGVVYFTCPPLGKQGLFRRSRSFLVVEGEETKDRKSSEPLFADSWLHLASLSLDTI
ncbi:hypothetical protein B0H19DRAFT_1064305 [Mycena capillaripes]|nr:hypothetical protein B0H19DRAFT_1064305 [Mycena capillaripes]